MSSPTVTSRQAPTTVDATIGIVTIRTTFTCQTVINVVNCSGIEAFGKQLLQVHFHTPSEHAVGSSQYPLEARFVHRAEDDTLVVIGIFLKEGAENAALSGLLKHLPEQEAETESFDDATPVDGVACRPRTIVA